MKRRFARWCLLGSAFALADTAAAQAELDAQASAAEEQPRVEVSEDDLETFATIYAELQQTARRYEEEMAAVESEEEAQSVQTRMQRESIETLEEHGWTQEKFNSVAEAVNRSPELVEKALELIEEKS